MLGRLEKIVDILTVIALRRANPPWIPYGGKMSYLCWRDYHKSNGIVMPYPGSRLAQPGWWEHDLDGFNDLETWCRLKHEQVTLMRAMKILIPDEDKVWLKDD
jgi:hypothetical protein